MILFRFQYFMAMIRVLKLNIPELYFIYDIIIYHKENKVGFPCLLIKLKKYNNV